MKPFMNADFLLPDASAQRLYHEYAASMPIIDDHCHQPLADIAGDTRFENRAQVWLGGDHYKWRAMRANGIVETGGLLTQDHSLLAQPGLAQDE